LSVLSVGQIQITLLFYLIAETRAFRLLTEHEISLSIRRPVGLPYIFWHL